jgi:TolB-like protein
MRLSAIFSTRLRPSIGAVFFLLSLLFASVPLLGAERLSVAVIPFENLTKEKSKDGWGRAIQGMVQNALGNVRQIQLIERDKLSEILKELKLGQSEFIDPKTAPQIGKLVGAQYILAGRYITAGAKVRIDIRLIETESGRVLLTEEITDLENELLGKIPPLLSEKITTKLNLILPLKEQLALRNSGTKEFKAFDYYGKGLLQESQKQFKEAENSLRAALKLDPQFNPAAEELASLEKRILVELGSIQEAELEIEEWKVKQLEANDKIAEAAKKQLRDFFEKNKASFEAARYDAEYFASIGILAVYAGFQGDPVKEKELLVRYTTDFLTKVPVENSYRTHQQVLSRWEKAGVFFGDTILCWPPTPKPQTFPEIKLKSGALEILKILWERYRVIGQTFERGALLTPQNWGKAYQWNRIIELDALKAKDLISHEIARIKNEIKELGIQGKPRIFYAPGSELAKAYQAKVELNSILLANFRSAQSDLEDIQSEIKYPRTKWMEEYDGKKKKSDQLLTPGMIAHAKKNAAQWHKANPFGKRFKSYFSSNPLVWKSYYRSGRISVAKPRTVAYSLGLTPPKHVTCFNIISYNQTKWDRMEKQVAPAMKIDSNRAGMRPPYGYGPLLLNGQLQNSRPLHRVIGRGPRGEYMMSNYIISENLRQSIIRKYHDYVWHAYYSLGMPESISDMSNAKRLIHIMKYAGFLTHRNLKPPYRPTKTIDGNEYLVERSEESLAAPLPLNLGSNGRPLLNPGNRITNKASPPAIDEPFRMPPERECVNLTGGFACEYPHMVGITKIKQLGLKLKVLCLAKSYYSTHPKNRISIKDDPDWVHPRYTSALLKEDEWNAGLPHIISDLQGKIVKLVVSGFAKDRNLDQFEPITIRQSIPCIEEKLGTLNKVSLEYRELLKLLNACVAYAK